MLASSDKTVSLSHSRTGEPVPMSSHQFLNQNGVASPVHDMFIEVVLILPSLHLELATNTLCIAGRPVSTMQKVNKQQVHFI